MSMNKARLRFSRHWVLAGTIAVASSIAPVAAAASTWLDLASTGSQSEIPTKVVSGKNATWIQVSSYSFGVGKTTTVPGGGGLASGKKTSESMDVTIAPNPAAAQTLFNDAAQGKVLQTVRLYMMKPSATGKGMIPNYVVTLKDAIVSSDQWTGGSGDKPTEHITFNYRAIEIQYNDAQKTDKDAKSPVSWNVVQNKPPSGL
jgi:type VI protein secretion system component Hcp